MVFELIVQKWIRVIEEQERNKLAKRKDRSNMSIVTCLLCSVLIWVFVEKKKVSFIKLFFVNVLLITMIYSYYIGYSAIELEAAFLRMSPNAIYCSVMSVVAAGVISIIRLYQNNRKKESVGKLDYHIESINKKYCGSSYLRHFW